jgi:UDP-N-acetylglucosamine--N-acetylmuramyl-(pentapeptide) pyrophosphoryl-undecaprenol N-acetylglucosamine transferase
MHALESSGPRIILAGGGTGGHVYPALAVAEAIRQIRPESQLLYIGGDRMEAKAVPAAGLPFRQISVHGLAGRSLSPARRLRSIVELAIGLPLFQSIRILREFRPDVVLGTGGYVSGPVLLAARIVSIPCAALDGNRVPGHTSRIVARIVDLMAIAHGEAAGYFSTRLRRGARVEVTGLPVRAEVITASREAGTAALGLDPCRATALILGGSLGSERINRAVTGALELLAATDALRELQLLHVTGERFAVPASEGELPGGRYRAVPYLGADYAQALAAADLVVSRAGAGTLAEIAARGLPAILIPWAKAATGEQVQNAQALARAGAAIVILDRDLTPERLAAALSSSLGRRAELDRMAAASRDLGYPGAARRVAELVLELAARRKEAGQSAG